MLGRGFFAVAVLFFFFAAVGVTVVPNVTAWAFVMLALGLAVGSWSPLPWPKKGP